MTFSYTTDDGQKSVVAPLKNDKNTSDDMPDKKVIRSTKILIQMVKDRSCSFNLGERLMKSTAMKSLEMIHHCCEEIKAYFR
ncbi:hypothetical protein H5410_052474 [Solanum commersonii]|uniref:Uncharacterized protein n=1 Tax=Solanum commersonii TaxID=4109 RepID=A0A9J5X2A8_SOLCO|nr:hypothetical protein H5410_052474 [Solanum commersonii]